MTPLVPEYTRPLLPPTQRASLNVFANTGSLVDLNVAAQEGRHGGQVDYGRYAGHPVEERLARLESAESALLFPSGMSAVTTTLLALAQIFPEGSEIIVGSELYRQTLAFCDQYLRRLGISVVPCPPNVGADINQVITPNTKAIFLECPTNPYLRVPDLRAITKIAKERGILTIVDSTLASPVNLKPIEYGADLVVESATKYLAGHHDLIAGVVAGSETLIKDIRVLRGMSGPISSPAQADQLDQYLKTLDDRVARHNKTGLELAKFLEEHPLVEKVWYPGLSSHPDHQNAQELLSGFGGVVTFTIRGNKEDTSYFIDQLRTPQIGPSFGGHEALVEQVTIISHFSKTDEELRAIGIPHNLVRYSVGTVPADELIPDLAQALEKLSARQRFWRGFDKSPTAFPNKRHATPLNACFVSPTHPDAVKEQISVATEFGLYGTDALETHTESKTKLRVSVAKLLSTTPENISIVPNFATAASLIAEGFPFKPGDEVIGYTHEYPSNYDAWNNLARKGVNYKLLVGESQGGQPTSWSLEELERAITPKTKIVAVSHVQYLSGFAVNLKALGEICLKRGAFLVIDAAQSAGALPILPAQWGIDAVAASGWKWLAGPTGSAFLYTSKRFREMIQPVLTGPDATTRIAYTERSAILHEDGRRFEPGTVNTASVAGLAAAIEAGILRYGVPEIQQELGRLQDYVVAGLDRRLWTPLVFGVENRSGILALRYNGKLDGIESYLKSDGILATVRGGYLRVAPPYYVTEPELDLVITLLNAWKG